NELLDSINACGDIKIEWELGKHNNKTFHAAELIVVSPGIPPTLEPLKEAREKNIPIISEIELAAQSLKEPLITITGTNGKTTVTTLIGEMFKADERPAYVGGNIGKPLLDYITSEQKADFVIAELSSFQLDITEKLTPALAVFTNLEQDHLDRYGDMPTYVNSKKRLLKFCDRNSFVVLNYDDPTLAEFANENSARLLWFTKTNPMTIGGAFAENFVGCYYNRETREIVARLNGKEEVYDLTQFRLFGEHNRENL